MSRLTLKKNTKLGQNFLVDHYMIRKIIQGSKINIEDVIYEVGTGKGILTDELCKTSKFVYSFELDSTLYSLCKRNLKHENLALFHGDGLCHVRAVRAGRQDLERSVGTHASGRASAVRPRTAVGAAQGSGSSAIAVDRLIAGAPGVASCSDG